MTDWSVCKKPYYRHWNPTYLTRQWVAGIFMVTLPVILLLSVALMIWRRHQQPLKNRSLGLILLCAVGSLVCMLLQVVLEELVTPPMMHCDVSFFSNMLANAFTGPPMLLRIIRLYHMLKVQHRKLESETGKAGSTRLARALKRSAVWTSPCRLYTVYAVACLPTLLATVLMYWAYPAFGHGCLNCGRTTTNGYLNFCLAVTYFGLTAYALIKTRNYVDSFFLRKEVVHWMAMWAVLFVIAVPFESVPSLLQLEKDGYYNGGFFFLAGAIGTVIISVILPTLGTYNIGPYAPRNRYQLLHGQNTINPLNGSRLSTSSIARPGWWEGADLLELLQDPVAFQFFSRHLMTEFSVENCKFWSDVEYFRAHFHAGEAGRLAALVMFETYLDENAPLMVNVSHEQRTAVAKAVESVETVSPSLLDECQAEIYKLMKRDSYARFRASRLFQQMVETIQDPEGARASPTSACPTLMRCFACCCRAHREPHPFSNDDVELTSMSK